MKIGICFNFFDPYFSGVDYYVLGMLNSLLKHDKDNSYCIITNNAKELRKNLPSETSNVDYVEQKILSRYHRVFWEHMFLPKLANKLSLDILHCTNYICPAFGSSVPYLVTVHDTIALKYPELCKFTNMIYFNLQLKKSIRKAAKIVTVSQHSADDIEHYELHSNDKTVVLHPGVDDIFFAKKSYLQLDIIKNKYMLPEHYLLFVGNNDRKKNLLQIIKSFNYFKSKSQSPHKLVIIGKRKWGKQSEIAKNYNLGRANIIKLGYVAREDLPALYQLADLFLFPSLYEGFGLPPLEAMASGTPVIASRNGSLEEVLGEAAYFVDPEDHLGIANAIPMLLGNSTLRDELSFHGYLRAKNYRWQGFGCRLLNIYKEVVS